MDTDGERNTEGFRRREQRKQRGWRRRGGGLVRKRFEGFEGFEGCEGYDENAPVEETNIRRINPMGTS
jgi:hypothetical protein